MRTSFRRARRMIAFTRPTSSSTLISALSADVATLVLGREAILADPPRSGLGPFAEALNGLAPSLRPPHLVYVSCHVDALGRDAAVLARAGYRAVAVDGIDQFPHTPHAEVVLLLRRNN